MLLWIGLFGVAHAAPLSPSGLSGPGVEIAAYGTSQRAWLREVGCTTAACDAWRQDGMIGAEAGITLATPVGLYAHGARVTEAIGVARFDGVGYAFGGGVRVGIPLGYSAGLHAWTGLEHSFTAVDDLSEQATTWTVDAGVVLRAGRVDDGIQAWAGAGVAPWSSTRATVLGGDLELALAARFPLELTAGTMWVSDPLLGPWDQRTRLGAGLTGSAGYRTGFSGFLTFLY